MLRVDHAEIGKYRFSANGIPVGEITKINKGLWRVEHFMGFEQDVATARKDIAVKVLFDMHTQLQTVMRIPLDEKTELVLERIPGLEEWNVHREHRGIKVFKELRINKMQLLTMIAEQQVLFGASDYN